MEKITIKKFLKDESAVTSIEYALIACLVALAIIPSLRFAGNILMKAFKAIAKILKKALKNH